MLIVGGDVLLDVFDSFVNAAPRGCRRAVNSVGCDVAAEGRYWQRGQSRGLAPIAMSDADARPAAWADDRSAAVAESPAPSPVFRHGSVLPLVLHRSGETGYRR
ncbi:hypothetical protein [Amycolatopsis methanolica]|uniref:hypothetical protein n=1 Tax=Amycolatopsis methanolica TaxID=1814 RepID=UPI00342342EA